MIVTLTEEQAKRLIQKVAEDIAAQGGRMYYAGGYVRDQELGINDCEVINIEVFDSQHECVEESIAKHSNKVRVSSSYSIHMLKGEDIDVTIPSGHKCIKMEVREGKTVEDVLRRCDFTINALLRNVLTGELIDLYGGLQDLQEGVITYVDAKTIEQDELLAIRACQLASRFNMVISEELMQLCQGLTYTYFPADKIFDEVQKRVIRSSRRKDEGVVLTEFEMLKDLLGTDTARVLPRNSLWNALAEGLLKSQAPSVMLNYMKQMGIIQKIFPELAALEGCQQDPKYHPEGDVWTHTMLTLDYLASIRHLSKDPLDLMLAGLLHDIGKPKKVIEVAGRVMSYNHAKLGVPIAYEVLARITDDKYRIERVLRLIRYHMLPHRVMYGRNRGVRKLVRRTDVYEQLLLAEADYMGRGPGYSYTEVREWYDKKLVEMCNQPYLGAPLISGKDLLK